MSTSDESEELCESKRIPLKWINPSTSGITSASGIGSFISHDPSGGTTPSVWIVDPKSLIFRTKGQPERWWSAAPAYLGSEIQSHGQYGLLKM